jgi:hypothetical protein
MHPSPAFYKWEFEKRSGAWRPKRRKSACRKVCRGLWRDVLQGTMRGACRIYENAAICFVDEANNMELLYCVPQLVSRSGNAVILFGAIIDLTHHFHSQKTINVFLRTPHSFRFRTARRIFAGPGYAGIWGW